MLSSRPFRSLIVTARISGFSPAPPWRDHPCSDSFRFVRDHQLGIEHQLRSQPVTRRARAEMAVERKMFWRQLAECEPRVGAAVVRRVTRFLPTFTTFGSGTKNHDFVPAPF